MRRKIGHNDEQDVTQDEIDFVAACIQQLTKADIADIASTWGPDADRILAVDDPDVDLRSNGSSETFHPFLEEKTDRTHSPSSDAGLLAELGDPTGASIHHLRRSPRKSLFLVAVAAVAVALLAIIGSGATPAFESDPAAQQTETATTEVPDSVGPTTNSTTPPVSSTDVSTAAPEYRGVDAVRSIEVAQGEGSDVLLRGHRGPIQELAILDDGRVVSASSDGTVTVWDLAATGSGVTRTYGGHDGESVESVHSLSDGRIASGGRDNQVHIWDPDDLTAAPIIHHHDDWVFSIRSLAGGRIVSADRSGQVHVWDPDDPTAEPVIYRGHDVVDRSDDDAVVALVALSDGRIASAGLYDNKIHVWEPDNLGVEPAIYSGHSESDSGDVWSMTELPNGLVASASFDQTVQIWDPNDSSNTLFTYTGHGDEAVRVVVSLPDGRIVSAGFDDQVHLWDPNKPGVPAKVYSGHVDIVWAVAELNDGRIASGGSHSLIRVWDPNQLG